MTTQPALIFTVHGTPRPQPRPRFVHGRVVSTASKPAKAWRTMIQAAARRAMEANGWKIGDPPFYVAGPVRVSILFAFKTPASHPERFGKPHTQRPDADNLAKGVMDAMQGGGVFTDDAQVADLAPVKRWADSAYTIVQVRQVVAVVDLPGVGLPSWLAGVDCEHPGG